MLGFVDVPGHENFVHNMLAGATGIDFVLLVVAADDGVMPQTREHLAIVDLLGIARGDRGAHQGRSRVGRAAAPRSRPRSQNALLGTGAGRRRHRAGLGGHRRRHRRSARDVCSRRRSASARAPRRAAFASRSTARSRWPAPARSSPARCCRAHVDGRADRDRQPVRPGRARALDPRAEPSGRARRGGRALRAQPRRRRHHQGRDRARRCRARSRAACADRPDRRDACACSPSRAKPVTQWMPVRLHHAATDVAARVVLLGDAPIAPGTEARVQLVLEQPIAAAAHDRFVLRDTTAQRTIAGGRFLDLRAPARKRRTPERLAQLDAHAIERSARRACGAARPCAVLRRPCGIRARPRARAGRRSTPWRRDGLVIRIAGTTLGLSPADLAAPQAQRSLATLEAFHAGQSGPCRHRARAAAPAARAAPSGAGLRRHAAGLARAHEVALDGAWVQLPGHEVRLTPADEKLWAQIRPLLGAAERFRPPRVRDIAGALGEPETDVRRLLKLLGRMGRLDEVAHDHFFLRGTVAEMVEIAADVAAQADRRRVHRGAVPRPARQRPQGRDPDPRILRSPWRDVAARRPAPHQQASARSLPPSGGGTQTDSGRESSPVGRPDFKSGRGREPVLGGFDSLSLPPHSRSA